MLPCRPHQCVYTPNLLPLMGPCLHPFWLKVILSRWCAHVKLCNSVPCSSLLVHPMLTVQPKRKVCTSVQKPKMVLTTKAKAGSPERAQAKRRPTQTRIRKMSESEEATQAEDELMSATFSKVNADGVFAKAKVNVFLSGAACHSTMEPPPPPPPPSLCDVVEAPPGKHAKLTGNSTSANKNIRTCT